MRKITDYDISEDEIKRYKRKIKRLEEIKKKSTTDSSITECDRLIETFQDVVERWEKNSQK